MSEDRYQSLGIADGQFHQSEILDEMKAYRQRTKSSNWENSNYLIQDMLDPRLRELLKNPDKQFPIPCWPEPYKISRSTNYRKPDGSSLTKEIAYGVNVPTERKEKPVFRSEEFKRLKQELHIFPNEGYVHLENATPYVTEIITAAFNPLSGEIIRSSIRNKHMNKYRGDVD